MRRRIVELLLVGGLALLLALPAVAYSQLGAPPGPDFGPSHAIACLGEDQPEQVIDQAFALCQRDKVIRPAKRVATRRPARQDFVHDGLAGRQVHDGLKIGFNLLFADRCRKGLQLCAAAGRACSRRTA